MQLTPQDAIKDLEDYTYSCGFSLSQKARDIFLDMETRGFEYNRPLIHFIIFPSFIKTIPELRSLMLKQGHDPDTALAFLNKLTSQDIANKDSFTGKYDDDETLYSNTKSRGGYREQLIDYAMSTAKKRNRTEILVKDIFEGYLECHDVLFPATDNSSWADEALHVTFNTLSHFFGKYEQSLWVSFDKVREELQLGGIAFAKQAPLESTPPYLKHSVLTFLADNPDYRKNCFLIMPFRETDFHSIVHAELKDLFSELGFHLHRADDKEYTNDVFTNIETYIHGCKFGIALHERVISDDHNPNVSLEIGYMLGQKKEVCLLKEKTVQRLPSDLQGRLYVEFDGFNIKGTLRERVRKWLSDKHLIRKLQSEFA